jgi:tRNA pseudouridine38-40 synthase
LAAGRTDSGVHASGQVVAFDLDWEHPLEALQAALNAHLPEDIAVRAVEYAPPDFHPRYDAQLRRYQYRLYCQPVRAPLLDRIAWRVWPAVTREALQAAADLLVGEHDFAAFGRPHRPGGSTVRQVATAIWRPFSAGGLGEGLLFEIAGNAFLYHMVRRLVFAQVAVAAGRVKLAALRAMLANPPEQPLQGLAPAQGLILVAVQYPSLGQPPAGLGQREATWTTSECGED